MAATPEKKVKERVVKTLKENGVYYFFPATFGMGRSGIPDIVCCINGRFLAIECKTRGNKPTALQERELQAIRDAGGTSMVVNEDNQQDVVLAIQRLRQE